MDETALRGRCPRASLIGPASLARHRFVLMGRTGYANVQRDPAATVHGVLFDLALSDIPPLDRYEDVAHGLYAKAVQSVVRPAASARRALIYIGSDETVGGRPPSGYMEGIVAAARSVPLPTSYVAVLETFLPRTSKAFPSFARKRT